MNNALNTLSLIVVALALAACASKSPRGEPKRLLLRYDGPVAAAPLASRPRLVVRNVAVPDYLDRRELVRRVSDAEIVRDETAYWAERPSKSITRWVTQALGARRSDFSVESFSTADGRAPDAVLAITLDSFEPAADGTLRLRGSWIYAPNAKVAAQSGRFDADAVTSNPSAEASVAALQKALNTAVQTVAAQLPQIPPAADPRR